MEKFNPADNIQDLQYFGEFGGVNPSISDSSTYTFLSAKTMFDTFEGNAEGCYLYSRHSSPSNLYLDKALAAMEGTESANVAASGMGAITPTLLQLCGNGDHIVSSRTIYGGTYAFLKNFVPRMGIKTTFVDITKLDVVEAAITPNTKVLYCETVSNPLLEVADIASLAKIAKKHNLTRQRIEGIRKEGLSKLFERLFFLKNYIDESFAKKDFVCNNNLIDVSDDIASSLNYENETNLIVPHHGGKAGKYKHILNKKIIPNKAIISVGQNHYGHPMKSYISNLKQDKFKILSTKKNNNDILINL